MSLIPENSNSSRIKSLVFRDNVYTVGFIGSIIGCLLLIITLTAEKTDAGIVAALICYLISFVYWLVFSISEWVYSDSYNNSYRLNPAFLLAFICGYTINYSSQYLGIFSGWFNILVVIICISHLMLPFLDFLPSAVKITISAIMGIAIIVFLYLAFCLIPDYVYGAAFFLHWDSPCWYLLHW